jgi:hypothetical protein
VLHTSLIAAVSQTETASRLAQAPDSEQAPVAQLRDLFKVTIAEASTVEIEPHTWWLKDDRMTEPPLADRVEQAVIEALYAQATWPAVDLLEEIYRRFADHLTPDRALVATMIHSYAEELPDDSIQLRAEDQRATRAAEVQHVSALLLKVGQQLGFEAHSLSQAAGANVTWRKPGANPYTFVVQTTAKVETLLQTPGGVLVIPGGRATLLQHKLSRDARLHMTTWQVLKFSALRQVAYSEDLTEEIFRLAFGLQPPIDQPASQIQLL